MTIELSENLVNSLETSITGGFSSLLPIFAIIIGVNLGFFVLRKIIFIITLTKR